MSNKDERLMVKEQIERRRLSRLLDALPVFSGYISADGHLSRTRPKTDASFLWSLPAFSYAHDSVTQIVDLCETAARGERVQVERPYRKFRPDKSDYFRDGLLTLTPIFDEHDYVDEIAVSLIDTDDVGVAPVNEFAKSRLSSANQRISVMLDLAQTVIEASQSSVQPDRTNLTRRLDALASVIDLISDPNTSHVPLQSLIEAAVKDLADEAESAPLQMDLNQIRIPVLKIPLITLLLSELFDNATRHGAWRRGPKDPIGVISIQAELLDNGGKGKKLNLHWIEDHGPKVPAIIDRGFGLILGERLFPQLTGGDSQMLDSEDGISWTFRLPITEDETDPDEDQS